LDGVVRNRAPSGPRDSPFHQVLRSACPAERFADLSGTGSTMVIVGLVALVHGDSDARLDEQVDSRSKEIMLSCNCLTCGVLK
jgi:hypothetical protein